MQLFWMKLIFVTFAFTLWYFPWALCASESKLPAGARGDPLCPCLPSLKDYPINEADQQAAVADLGESFASTNYTTYGLGCYFHDADTPQCSTTAECNSMMIPVPVYCDKSWCSRQFCYVDPLNCQLTFRASLQFPSSSRFYSFATCGYTDSFTRTNRFAALDGRTFRVGLLSNSGGWKGSFSSDGSQFGNNTTTWSGPLIDFMTTASYRGNFAYNITAPSSLLQPYAREFSNSNSSFDLCMYATSLGYLDACIAQYTISDDRSLKSDWILLGQDKLFLFVINEGITANSYGQFVQSVGTIFQPFTLGNWLFILFFVIPVLGCLMIVHEFGRAGSAYPREETVLYKLRNGEEYARKKTVPYLRTVIKSIYINLLAVLQSSYEQSVVSVGAMLNLVGTSFFILTIIAVYTANLAAILTQSTQRTSVKDFNDAIQKGYRFCTDRNNVDFITSLYPNVTPSMFVKDPVDMGGDGSAGFSCPTCMQRTRTFDHINPQLAATDDRYCHAAIARMEDLQMLQSIARHCNKTAVGLPLRSVPLGFPVFEEIRPALAAFVSKMLNEGAYDKSMITYQPRTRCSEYLKDEGSSLSISELSGIWVVSFGFAFLGLLYGVFEWVYRRTRVAGYTVEPIHKRDQKGERLSSFVKEPSWVTRVSTGDNNSQSTLNNGSSRSHFKDEDEVDGNRKRVSFSLETLVKRNDNSSSSSSSSEAHDVLSTTAMNRTATTDPIHPSSSSEKHSDTSIGKKCMTISFAESLDQTDDELNGSSSAFTLKTQKEVDRTGCNSYESG